jgi:predicted ferric reductase
MPAYDIARNRRLAPLIAASGYSITLLYLLYGGTSQGKQWFRNLVPNGVLLLIVFTLPLFKANTAAILLLKDGYDAAGNIDSRSQQKSCYNRFLHSTTRRVTSSRLFTISFVILPCVAFFLCSVHRHYLSAMETYPMKTDSKNIDNINQTALLEEIDYYNYQVAAWRWNLVHHILNSSAIVGLIAFSHLLIPVSRHSPLILLLNWTPQEAMVMHQYTGRLAICGIGMHGLGHFMHAYWRWWNLFVGGYGITAESNAQNRNWMEKSFWRGFIPPMECWQQTFRSNSSTRLDFGPGCIRNDVSCICVDFWTNFTGLLGLIALLVLMVGSLNHIRRNYYKVFYIVHITAAPLFIIAAILHYNRTILYMCPSLLYYSSQTLPVYVESWLSRRRCSKGARILSVSKIPCPSPQRPNGKVLSIEFEASRDTMNKFQPGSYCTLQIPSLSLVAHPFTVNIVPEHSNRLRLLVRQSGPFTTQLGELLECKSQLEAYQTIEDEKKECDVESQYASTISLPAMHITMYSTSQRMKQLHQHHAALMVACGIGITPYLSMLTEISTSSQASRSLKSVVLHWICRDAALIQYVHKQYFAAVLEKCNETDQGVDVSIKIITHFTGSNDDANCYNDGLGSVSYQVNTCDGAPVKSSAYSDRNMMTLVTFAAIFCFGATATLYAYTYLQSVEVVSTRIIGLLAICIISVVLSTISVIVFNLCQKTEKVKYLSLSTDQRYGSTFNTQKSQEADYKNNTPGYEFNAKGRPSEATLFSSLQECENENLGLFLCGPSSMVKQLRSFLSMSKREDVNVYEEIFEL